MPLSPLPAFSAEPPRRFRLIVLDVGGTIIQDRGDVVRTLMSSMQAHGVTVTAEEIGPWRGAAKHSVIEHFVAENTKLAVKERQTLSKKIYRDFVEQVSAAYKDVPPIAGTEDALRKLAERGYLLATNTGFEREIVMPILSRQGWVKYFEAIVASDDVSEGRPEIGRAHV